MHRSHISSLVSLLVAAACAPDSQNEAANLNEALVARASEFELDTEWQGPPGDPMELAMSGFAKILCSAVFITGLDPAFAADNVGYSYRSPKSVNSSATRLSTTRTVPFTSL
jgi:hypothetical protein